MAAEENVTVEPAEDIKKGPGVGGVVYGVGAGAAAAVISANAMAPKIAGKAATVGENGVVQAATGLHAKIDATKEAQAAAVTDAKHAYTSTHKLPTMPQKTTLGEVLPGTGGKTGKPAVIATQAHVDAYNKEVRTFKFKADNWLKDSKVAGAKAAAPLQEVLTKQTETLGKLNGGETNIFKKTGLAFKNASGKTKVLLGAIVAAATILTAVGVSKMKTGAARDAQEQTSTSFQDRINAERAAASQSKGGPGGPG